MSGQQGAPDWGRRAAEWVWYSPSPWAGLVRLLLRPASALFAFGVARRSARYDRLQGQAELPVMAVPALSVGNLTVGGTGKTPVAAWFASRLTALGGSPALVLRGYGDDEWLVHQRLNPSVAVIRHADRVAGTLEARQGGADCVVLDDAFQHRRARRVSDVVLISADRFTDRPRLLPAGPYREPLAALQRATAVVVTVKAAGPQQVEATVQAVRQAAPQVGVAVVRLIPRALERASEGMGPQQHPWDALPGRPVVLVSAIADPEALAAQVRSSGADLVADLRFGDHHTFTAGEVQQVLKSAAQAAESRGITVAALLVVCTLKDAVKLSPQWPRAGPALWYVSQYVAVERGAEVLDAQCHQVLSARGAAVPTSG